MEEQVARFVARGQKEALPPPPSETGIFARARRHLFATPGDSVLTVIAALFIAYVVYHLYEWAVAAAVFEGSDRTACVSNDAVEIGACWIFVKAKFGQFVYGLYPLDQRWRVDIVFALLVLLVAPLAIPRVPYKGLNAVLLFAVFPLISLVLLTGGEFNLGGGGVAFFFAAAAFGALSVASTKARMEEQGALTRIASGLAILAAIVWLASCFIGADSIRFLGMRFSVLALLSFAGAIASIAVLAVAALRAGEGPRGAVQMIVPAIIAIVVIVLLAGDFGLTTVPTSLWGGLLLTLVVALTGIAASLPLGILLALGRRSKMPAVKLMSIIFIEFWRGVPLITVLFMANFMLPLFLPTGVTINQLLRALVGVALFSAAYMAEVVRGGLQAVPKGQYEGAAAMALTYWQTMRMIILPQALKLVIPGIVNTFIGLFKDTSLVYIIGLADLLGTVRRGFNDPNWITETTPATGLVFAAFVYWLFCFSMSRYSIFMERRLDTGHKR
ncbi:amino acid ABC transporter permease [Aurantimonas sp. MSK8Z-1]|uniref:amino acid ABC transporter permease n=1 Tax=Mangrovibrevibacter kandeliae TaxID=2968473 RepID=UPI0021190033|nr:amino acid ABC transporter permease [Aurantimonas sp. MSK8Z-1]MCW4114475.1 amino acid ABC transporter permease [Aurantimonas sp. MSK8Z-1]